MKENQSEANNLKPLRVLMIEDSEDDALLISHALEKGGFIPDTQRVETVQELSEALRDRPWDVILCDFNLPNFSGMNAIDLLRELHMDIPLLLVSGVIGEEMAVECMRRGANDYIMKENLSRLCPAIERELADASSRSKRRQAEEALRKSEANFKTIANYTVDWESWFGPDGKYLWVNPAVERITGYSADEVLAMPDFISVMIAEEDQVLFRERFNNAILGSRGDNFEFRCLHRDGLKLWLSVSWQPVFDSDGNFLGIRTSGRDITPRKQAEEERRLLEKQLFEAQKMEAIGTLAGGIAHDFNNILSGIIGYAELAEYQTDEKNRQQNIRQLLKATERARELVKQILAFSRHVEYDKKPMDLNLVIREAMKLLRATVPTTIDMRSHIADHPVIIDADFTQIHQVIMNICTNATHAMGAKGGILDLALSQEEIKVGSLSRELDLASGIYAKLRISDTGYGIDPVNMPRIFEPFFTTKKIGEGTGLGLSVVYGIVKNHGGSIKVVSQPGQGTAFDVYLPVLEKAEIKRNDPKAELIPRGSERILFVDDESDLTVLANRILTSLGYSVTICTDSLEALKIYRAQPDAFDLVITDMNIPLMSGSDLAAEMLKLRPEQAIILCTGYSDYMNTEKAAQMGIKAFVLKPLTRTILASIVRKVLGEK
jgi:PAS domain S-box-containing protein